MLTVPTLEWRPQSRADLMSIVAYIAEDNPDAAQALKDEIETKASALLKRPKLYKPGRMKGTWEMVVRPNYVVVYRENIKAVTILRVLHAAQKWPLAK